MNYQTTELLSKTWSNLRQVWRNVSIGTHQQGSIFFDANLSDDDLLRLQEQIQRCLDAPGRELSARAETAALGQAYLELNEVGRGRFLKFLASHFGVNIEQIDHAIDGWQKSNLTNCDHHLQTLRQTLTPPRMKLLTQFNELPEGVKFLVDMRGQLMTLAKHDPSIAALEADLKRLLVSWFDIGFLSLEQITWHSPASLLEKLIAYEAVHEIRSWADLKNRLDSDRRCYAFLHPNMPGEPLIFVEVALTIGLANNVQILLDETEPVQNLTQADTAIFYSISNAQQGLAGISFGNFLIKRVVAHLSQEFPNLRQFATLSPIVKFRRWLEKKLVDETSELLTPSELKGLNLQCERLGVETSLIELLALPEWSSDLQACDFLQPLLMKMAARYLAQEQYQQRALDPVAHFHLSNGAQIEQLNWLADQSEKGMQQSFGLMVNYLYQRDRIETNSLAYTVERKIGYSGAISALLKK